MQARLEGDLKGFERYRLLTPLNSNFR
jgi:hypothetical protein